MADNLNVDTPAAVQGSVRTVDIGGQQYQVVILSDASGNQLGTTAAPYIVRLSDGTDLVSIDGSGNLMVALGAALDRTSAPTLSDNSAARELEINAKDNAFTNAFPAWVVEAATAEPGTVYTAGRMAPAAGDGAGRVFNMPFGPTANFVDGNASNTDGTSTQVIAAGAAGIRTYITSVAITNAHASTFGYVELKDGASAVYTIPAPPESGAIVHFPTPLRGTAATAWNFDPSAAITTIYCSMAGFQSKI